MWLQTRQRWSRHAGYPALSRAPLDRVHGALHGTGTGSVQGFLERLNESRRQLPPPASIFRATPSGVAFKAHLGPHFRWGPTRAPGEKAAVERDARCPLSAEPENICST